MITEMYDAVLFDLFGTLVDDRGNALDGAREVLSSLPPERWGIVTSCPKGLALALIQHAALPEPPVIVTSDDVERSKPDPQCYSLGAQRLGRPPERCLVVEDSLHGIAAATAAGMTVVAVARGRQLSPGAGDVHVIEWLTDLELQVAGEGLLLRR